jgi:erythromycin esterase
MCKLPVFLLFILLSVGKASGQDFIDQVSKRVFFLGTDFSIDQKANGVAAAALLRQLNTYSALGLGEATHGTHEFFVAKANLIQQLITAGRYDRIGLEAPYAEVEELNQFLLAHKGELGQLLKNLRQYTYETAEFADLIYALQLYNKQAKIKVLFYGYDFQSPFKALANFRTAARGNPEIVPAIDSLEAAYFSMNNELYTHQFDPVSYSDILQKSRRLYASFYTPHNSEVQRNLKSYKQFLLLNDPELSAIGMERISQIRDSLMASNIMDEIKAGHAMLVWAHNGHIQRSSNKFSKSMGQYLQDNLSSGYGSIGLSTYQGFYTAYSNEFNGVSQMNPLQIPLTNQLEYHLQQLKVANYLFHTKGLVVPAGIDEHRFVVYSATDNQFQKGNMIEVFDYILFISKTTGSSNYHIKKN